MPLPHYLPHVLYSVALTSVSMHLLLQRKTAESDRAHVTAQITILESIVHRLRTEPNFSDDELEKLRKLARAHGDSEMPLGGPSKGIVGWKDVILGKRQDDSGEINKWDRKDLEKGAWPSRFTQDFADKSFTAQKEMESA
jgi:hypothetical protein